MINIQLLRTLALWGLVTVSFMLANEFIKIEEEISGLRKQKKDFSNQNRLNVAVTLKTLEDFFNRHSPHPINLQISLIENGEMSDRSTEYSHSINKKYSTTVISNTTFHFIFHVDHNLKTYQIYTDIDTPKTRKAIEKAIDHVEQTFPERRTALNNAINKIANSKNAVVIDKTLYLDISKFDAYQLPESLGKGIIPTNKMISTVITVLRSLRAVTAHPPSDLEQLLNKELESVAAKIEHDWHKIWNRQIKIAEGKKKRFFYYNQIFFVYGMIAFVCIAGVYRFMITYKAKIAINSLQKEMSNPPALQVDVAEFITRAYKEPLVMEQLFIQIANVDEKKRIDLVEQLEQTNKLTAIDQKKEKTEADSQKEKLEQLQKFASSIDSKYKGIESISDSKRRKHFKAELNQTSNQVKKALKPKLLLKELLNLSATVYREYLMREYQELLEATENSQYSGTLKKHYKNKFQKFPGDIQKMKASPTVKEKFTELQEAFNVLKKEMNKSLVKLGGENVTLFETN